MFLIADVDNDNRGRTSCGRTTSAKRGRGTWEVSWGREDAVEEVLVVLTGLSVDYHAAEGASHDRYRAAGLHAAWLS